jgi:outer membrane protein OmpA-like peptidoglycan-associated protein
VKEVVQLNQNIMFDFDSDVIRSDQESNLDDISKFVSENPDTLIVIKGFASVEGPEAYNTLLSARRATAVEWALMDRGIDTSTIKSVSGEGETDVFGELLKENRRVVVISLDE